MFKVPNQYRVRKGQFGSDQSTGNNGLFVLPLQGKKSGIHAQCLASDGTTVPDIAPWEHVSVILINISNSGRSYPVNRCPTWEEMCLIKSMFWGDEDTALQLHPPKSEYVSLHPHCLHLWRKVGQGFEMPPSSLTGLRQMQGEPRVGDHVVNTEDDSYGMIKSIYQEKGTTLVQLINHGALKGEHECASSKLRFATQEEIQKHLYPNTVMR